MTSEIKVDTISENTSANGVTIDGLTIKDGNIIGDVALAGTTPTFTIGDAGAEDASLIFDGNAQDFYVALDDSADDLVIGLGNTIGTTPIMSFDENKDVVIHDGGLTITTADNTNQLTLVSTDADGGAGPKLTLQRDSGSPADGDVGGRIHFVADDDAGNTFEAALIDVTLNDVSNGSEDATLDIKGVVAGSEIKKVSFGAETVFNEDSADIDFRVESNSLSHMLFVDANLDKVAIGHSAPTAMLHVKDNANDAVVRIETTDADANVGPILDLYRNSSSASDDDNIGDITFTGNDSAGNLTTYMRIDVRAGDATNGDEDGFYKIEMPIGGTDVEFNRTGAFGHIFNENGSDIDFRIESSSNANQFKLDAGANYVSFGTSTTSTGFNTGSVLMTDTRTTSNFPVLTVENDNASFAAQVISTGCLRSASSSFVLYEGRSGNGSNDAFNDIEFKVTGNGELGIDAASVTTGGADYAEMFEWKDGNPSSEDRRGYSVVLDGNQVVKATDSDDASKIIGVVSTLPVVIGDSDMEDKWKFKYLKDDFGQHIREEITITEWTEVDADGNKKLHGYESDRIPSGLSAPSDAVVKTVDTNGNKFTRKKLNPDWDSSKTYIRRQDRKEWNAIGLMGKLRMLKGQPTGTNWIKMRDISDTVEEWLVR